MQKSVRNHVIIDYIWIFFIITNQRCMMLRFKEAKDIIIVYVTASLPQHPPIILFVLVLLSFRRRNSTNIGLLYVVSYIEELELQMAYYWVCYWEITIKLILKLFWSLGCWWHWTKKIGYGDNYMFIWNSIIPRMLQATVALWYNRRRDSDDMAYKFIPNIKMYTFTDLCVCVIVVECKVNILSYLCLLSFTVQVK